MTCTPAPRDDPLPEQAAPLPCQTCGGETVFGAAARPDHGLHRACLRCCQCGQERRDLAALDFKLPRA